MEDAERTSSIQSKTSVVSESVYNTRAGTRPKSIRNKRDHLAAGWAPGFGVNVNSGKRDGGFVSKYLWCGYRQGPQWLIFTPPQRKEKIQLITGWKEKY